MSWLDAWSDAVVRASWQGAAVVAAVWLVGRALPKLPPAWRCWAWRAACAKLVLSLAVAGAVAVPLLPAPRAPAPASTPAEGFYGPDGSDVPFSVAAEAPGVVASPPPPAPARSRLPAIVFALWLAGVALSVARLVRGHARAAALLRGAAPVTDVGTVALFNDLCRRMAVARTPRLLASDETRSPLVAGLFRPAVVLPRDSVSVEPERLRMMVAHELAHVRRRDLWWNWLPAAAQALLWFHPLAWLAARELRAAQEAACDALALSATGAPPSRYGQMLLDVVAAARAPLRLPRTSLVTIVETRTTVERRLAAMTHYRPTPPTGRARALAAASLACFCLVAVVPWKLVAQSPPAGSGPAARPAGPARGVDPVAPAGQNPTGSAENPFGGSPGAGAPEDQPDPLLSSGGILGRGYVTAPQFGLSARVAGTVVEVPVRPGQRVKKGELIARVDYELIRAELEGARAKTEIAKQELIRAGDKDATPDQQIARAQLRAAEAQVALVQHKLDSARVVAPADGVLADVGAKEGAAVREGAPLATLVAVDTLAFATAADARELSRLKEGQRVKLRIDALAPAVFDGEVSFISPSVETNTGQVRVGITIKDPKGVRPGMGGTAAILVEPREPQTYREALERGR